MQQDADVVNQEKYFLKSKKLKKQNQDSYFYPHPRAAYAYTQAL